MAISKEKKLQNLPESFKNLGHFIIFFVEMWWFFLEFLQKIPLTMFLGTFFYREMAKFSPQK